MALSPRVVDLYRRTCREIPRVCAVFDLDLTEAEVRTKCRAMFDKHKHQKNPNVILTLLHEGEQNLREVMNHWQQKTHVMYLLGMSDVTAPMLPAFKNESAFLNNFYEGVRH